MKLKCSVIWFILGTTFFIFGIIIYFVIPIIIRQQLTKMLPLKNGSLVYQQWQNTTMPTYLQFWFFNVMNPDEVITGSKPDLRQIGPYTYQEYRIKYDIVFNDNGTVSYLQKRVFFFDRKRSVGDENDTFTTVNIPLIAIGDKIKDFNAFKKTFLESWIKSIENYGIFIKTSIRNVTWGYVDPFLHNFQNQLNLFGFHANPHVGLFYGKNNTNDNVYTVDSGNINLDNYLRINNWNGSNKLSMWNSVYANMINGTDGSMFGPFLNRSSRLYVFQSDICRSIYATYVDDDFVKGIPSLNYAAPHFLFANHTVNPDNYGFCIDGYCQGAGVLNLTRCVPGGAPVVMSQPHFYSAAPKYIDSVTGLNPSKEFRTILKLEPTTGLPLQLQKKLQINIAMEPVAQFMDMDNIPFVILPVMWLNESVLISDELASTIKNTLVLPVSIGKCSSLILMTCGIVLVALIILIQLKPTVYHHQLKSTIINYKRTKV